MTDERARSTEGGQNDPLVAMLAELGRRLALVDLRSTSPGEGHYLQHVLLIRREHIELRMYKESAHQRPHFHIEYKSEFAASYALDNFERLAGYMPTKYEDEILPLAQANKAQLVERWQSLNDAVKITFSEDSA